LDLPESLAWLWRDYDPAKTEQTYESVTTLDPARSIPDVQRELRETLGSTDSARRDSDQVP